jgi:3-deoxy-manno-octulosonate cytidylyltransferase (CMP-KDO synthetase)
MISWVVKAALLVPNLSGVYVATDSDEIAAAAAGAGAEAIMTSEKCRTGTDRVAEASGRLEADVIVNLQGDEPALNPANVKKLVELFQGGAVRMATLARPVQDEGELFSPDVVKVVCDCADDALYFSRSPIPYYRDQWRGESRGGMPPAHKVQPLVHLGVYGFTREALFAFTRLPRGRLEEAEELEQLRALEAGWKIRVAMAEGPFARGVDSPEDVTPVEEVLRKLAAV